MADKAEDVQQLGSSVNAIREYGEISDLYSEEHEMIGCAVLIQNLIAPTQINIEQQVKNKEES